ncbi:MAG: hypothetical protein MUE73_00985 [Planctomycetes bacterium]|jgi:uncharacterized protein with PIN domain|nr:hypothetical protein [Planctomycetota bacterium]
MGDEPELEPIPPLLHSVFLDGPFRSCSVCGEDLMLGAVPYQIQKVWRNREVVFEMAVCARCCVDLLRQFSRESLEKMKGFVEKHYRPVAGVSVCHFCAKILDEGSEREIEAVCSMARLLRPVVVVCADCNAKVQEDLSRKTREAWGDFMDRNFPGVPRQMEPENTPLLF